MFFENFLKWCFLWLFYWGCSGFFFDLLYLDG
nr:MAG TPA: hypothetical protein [Bacteriophage sp.]